MASPYGKKSDPVGKKFFVMDINMSKAILLSHFPIVNPIESLIANTIVFLIPTLTFLELRLIGRIFVSEIILIGLLPFLLLSKGWMLNSPLPKKLLFLGFFWLFAQIITDLIRATPFEDYTRGWFKIAFFLVHFMSLYLLLYGNKKRLILFATGLVFSGFLAYKFPSSYSYAESYPWKFGLGTPVTLSVILFSTTKFAARRRFLSSFSIILIAFLNLYMGFRSLAGICFLTGIYNFTQPRLSAKKISLKKTAFILLCMLISAVTFYNIYVYVAKNYWIGDKAYYIANMQSGKFGILLGGRIEIYSAARAIMDSPLIGHGSWAKNPHYIDYLKELDKLGYTVLGFDRMYKEGLIPTHSHISGAWVESGILGAVFWGWVLILIYNVLSYRYYFRDMLNPLIVYIGIRFIWDIMFSPFAAEGRLTGAFSLVLLMSALKTPTSESGNKNDKISENIFR